jgi:hypothetical protein
LPHDRTAGAAADDHKIDFVHVAVRAYLAPQMVIRAAAVVRQQGG